jgi:hypothetical protein
VAADCGDAHHELIATLAARWSVRATSRPLNDSITTLSADGADSRWVTSPKPTKNANLSWAKKAKNGEFYTQFLLSPKDETGKPVWVERNHPAADTLRGEHLALYCKRRNGRSQ